MSIVWMFKLRSAGKLVDTPKVCERGLAHADDKNIRFTGRVGHWASYVNRPLRPGLSCSHNYLFSGPLSPAPLTNQFVLLSILSVVAGGVRCVGFTMPSETRLTKSRRRLFGKADWAAAHVATDGRYFSHPTVARACFRVVTAQTARKTCVNCLVPPTADVRRIYEALPAMYQQPSATSTTAINVVVVYHTTRSLWQCP